MAGTYTYVKVKVKTENQQYEREGETDWVPAKEKLPAAYKVIADILIEIIEILIQRNPHFGLNPKEPPPRLESFSWRIYARTGKGIKGGTYNELQEGDPPVALMTPLPTDIDRTLEKYHQAQSDARQLSLL